MDRAVEGRRSVRGSVSVPGDKSVSHRALMLGSVARGRSLIRGLSDAEDVLSTERAVKTLGVRLHRKDGVTVVEGAGIDGFEALGGGGPFRIDCGNSGTTARLLAGLLSGAGIPAELTGDESLSRRPMRRVVDPLVRFGARIETREGRMPLELKGVRPGVFRYVLPVASAQVKSALLCCALFLEGTSTVTEPERTRDHTERMLRLMGCPVEVRAAAPKGREIAIAGRTELLPLDFTVPGDISSAVFFIAAALLAPRSEVRVKNVLLNETRSRILDVFRAMGGEIEVQAMGGLPEPVGEVRARSSRLKGVSVGGADIPLLIDEIPALAAAAFFAEGKTVVSGAQELRVKESDRVRGIVEMVKAFGGEVEELPDGFVLQGSAKAHPAEVESRGDHRLAMAASIIALNAEGRSLIRNAGCVDISFPGFFEELERIAL
jgi:3-phosphoshikimate 1-carboxyvinyltransferase